MYNTATATELAESDRYDNGNWFSTQTLYRKRTGEYFLGVLGNDSSYHAPEDHIRPLSLSEAKEWAECYVDGSTYEEIFGTIEDEDSGEIVQSLFAGTTCLCGSPKKQVELCCPACKPDLDYRMKEMIVHMDIPATEVFESMASEGFAPAGRCCLCSGNYVLGGHNPAPSNDDKEARCCSLCNIGSVLVSRLKSESNGA